MIQIGDALPACTLMEYVEVPGDGCSIGPNPVALPAALQGKTIALFAVPGAFTPTCSETHLPGFVAQADAFKAAGVDEIWCEAVNDAFVMALMARSNSPTLGHPKFPQAGPPDYDDSGATAMRAAASLRR